MVSRIILFIILFLTWLALSGHFSPLLLFFGLFSSVVAVFVTCLMENGSKKIFQGDAFVAIVGMPKYILYLVKEIFLSSIYVTKLVWKPKLKLSPVMVKIPVSLSSDVAVVTYANSITLTPGTATLDVSGKVFLIHAIDESLVESLKNGDMSREIAKFIR